jgi:hypothetical protein
VFGRARPGLRPARSTFASTALAAGVSVFELARIMGTSVRMIERHYGTLLDGSGGWDCESPGYLRGRPPNMPEKRQVF